MIRTIWRTLRMLIDIFLSGVADVTQIITGVRGLDRTEAQVYLAGLRRLALICLFVPLPILGIGIIKGSGTIVALVGIFWAVCTLLLSALGGILPFLIEVLRKIAAGLPIEKLKKVADGLEGVGQRYVRFVQWVLLTELVFTLLVAVFPIQNNLKALPIMAIGAAVLGILTLLGEKAVITKKLIRVFATIVLVGFTFSFFLPQSFKGLEVARGKTDEKISGIVSGERPLFPPKPAPYVPSYQLIARGEFVGKGFSQNDKIKTGWMTPETVRKGDKIRYQFPKDAYLEVINSKGDKIRHEGPQQDLYFSTDFGQITFWASKGADVYVELWGIR